MWNGKRAKGRRLIRSKRAAFGLGPQSRIGGSGYSYESIRRAVACTAWQAWRSGKYTNDEIRAYIARCA